MTITLIVTDDGYLECPWCHGIHVHVDRVRMVGRPGGEDRDGYAVNVDAQSRIDAWHVPSPDMPGRREHVDLGVNCENCGGGTLRFTQNKGSTEVTRF